MTSLIAYSQMVDRAREVKGSLLREILTHKLAHLKSYQVNNSESDTALAIQKLGELGYSSIACFATKARKVIIFAVDPNKNVPAYLEAPFYYNGCIKIKLICSNDKEVDEIDQYLNILLHHLFVNSDLYFINEESKTRTDLEHFEYWLNRNTNSHIAKRSEQPGLVKYTIEFRTMRGTTLKNMLTFDATSGDLLEFEVFTFENGIRVSNEVIYNKEYSYQRYPVDKVLANLYTLTTQ